MKTVLLLLTVATTALSARAQVLTSQYDNARTGANLHESVLTPANVNPDRFGKLFSLPVDGAVYGQPLYLPQLEMPGKGVHNVVFVATEHDSVYAFDADGNGREPLWKVSFINPGAGITPLSAADVFCFFIRPEVGITPTPVIDYPSGTLYVLARTREKTGVLSSRYVQRLHALAVTTGAEKFGGPVEIKASVPGHGEGSSGGRVAFDPLLELPRSALLLAGGRVYLTWASSCDVGKYHGWVMAYDAHTLAQAGALNTSPDAGQSGIWASDTGPAADDEGNVFLATGNGKFDAASGGRDYGDSLLKLALAGGVLAVRDAFTPFNERDLNAHDLDLGSGGPLLLPDQPGPHPHLVVVAGKSGVVYLLDRDHLGGYHADDDSNAVQALRVGADGYYGAPAYWNHHLYYAASDDVVRDFAVAAGRLIVAAEGNVELINPGATPSISANGARNAIIWTVSSHRWNEPDGPPFVLRAFDAAHLANELYSSERVPDRDHGGIGVRFTIPAVVNGRVYVSAKREVDVYGLLPASR